MLHLIISTLRMCQRHHSDGEQLKMAFILWSSSATKVMTLAEVFCFFKLWKAVAQRKIHCVQTAISICTSECMFVRQENVNALTTNKQEMIHTHNYVRIMPHLVQWLVQQCMCSQISA